MAESSPAPADRRAPGGPRTASPPTGRYEASAISFAGVSVVRDGRTVLDAVEWEVRPGERWVVLGPNGSGKTTLLHVAGARFRPSSGSATIVGERLGHCDLRTLRAKVSLVSGATLRALRPSLTVREVVVSGKDGSLFPFWTRYCEEDWAAADRMIERVMGAGAVPTDSPIHVLSEGERQQVLIARALMCEARLLLLDEPAAGLDFGARERLVGRLGAMASDPSVPPLVLVTHHLEEVPAGFTHAALLARGRMLAAGPLEAVLTAPTVSACFGVQVHLERSQERWWARAVT